MRYKSPTVCEAGQIELTIRVDRKSVEVMEATANGLPGSTLEELAAETLQEKFPRRSWRLLCESKKRFYEAKGLVMPAWKFRRNGLE